MRKQVTCKCSVYPFPHRLGGGKCQGAEWAESVFLHAPENCANCNSNIDHECQVAVGQESIEECLTYQEHLAGKQAEQHPVVIDTNLLTNWREEEALWNYK